MSLELQWRKYVLVLLGLPTVPVVERSGDRPQRVFLGDVGLCLEIAFRPKIFIVSLEEIGRDI